ncbi:hypothetical protein HHI36_023415 [Cryptolaemus montrouzieri]|uniref:Uncharacterized protein n=1 Tax=Cryptolaemus montrouzieri TaxID=559131 RepID=A0ABD2PGA9_9CUCU
MDDDYWNSSSLSNFNFDDEDLSTSYIESVANDIFSSKPEENLLLAGSESQNVYMVLPVEEMIQKMIHGRGFVLEVYKSYKDKLLLLDEAVKTLNGDIICRENIEIQYILQHTNQEESGIGSIFKLFKMRGNIEELENLYMATGFTTNIRDLYFLSKRNGANKQETLSRLKCFISSHSQYLNSSSEKKFFEDYSKFLEWQIIKQESCDSVIEQLAVICKKQWEQGTNDDRVNEFKSLFKISDAQFEWTIVNCLSFMGLWKKLIGMFIKQNWMSKKNMLKTSLNNEYLIWGVSRHNPPKIVLEQLLTCLNDTEKSLALAEKLKCHKFVIEYYISQRDRVGLLSCMSKVVTNSEEYFLISKALDAHDKKWKN